jgi:hypothetical protein
MGADAAKEKGGFRPRSRVSPLRLIIYRPFFLACGLSAVGGERTRPVSEKPYVC